MTAKEKLLFLSRHYPTEAQAEMARQMGFIGIVHQKVTFPSDMNDLKKMIDNLEIIRKIVALSAPTWVHVAFWEKVFTTIEFVPEGDIRDDPDWHGIFICRGLWVYTPTDRGVLYSYRHCDMDIDTQLKYMGLDSSAIGNNKL